MVIKAKKSVCRNQPVRMPDFHPCGKEELSKFAVYV
jgi:hypothetical protein